MGIPGLGRVVRVPLYAGRSNGSGAMQQPEKMQKSVFSIFPRAARPSRVLSADPEFTGRVFSAVPADLEDNLAPCTVRFFLQIAPVAVRLHAIIRKIFKAVKIFVTAGSFFEIFLARTAQGIEAGLALLLQRITAPVQVRHDGISDCGFFRQKTVVNTPKPYPIPATVCAVTQKTEYWVGPPRWFLKRIISPNRKIFKSPPRT